MAAALVAPVAAILVTLVAMFVVLVAMAAALVAPVAAIFVVFVEIAAAFVAPVACDISYVSRDVRGVSCNGCSVSRTSSCDIRGVR